MWLYQIVPDWFFQTTSGKWSSWVHSFNSWPDYIGRPFLPLTRFTMLKLLINILKHLSTILDIIQSLLIRASSPIPIQLQTLDLPFSIIIFQSHNILCHPIHFTPHLFNYLLVIFISNILIFSDYSVVIYLLGELQILYF